MIFLSEKNSTPELSIAMRLAKKNGVKTACCCCTEGTELDDLADLMLYGYSQTVYPNRFFGGVSRIGLMIMTRTIVEYMESEKEQELN